MLFYFFQSVIFYSVIFLTSFQSAYLSSLIVLVYLQPAFLICFVWSILFFIYFSLIFAVYWSLIIFQNPVYFIHSACSFLICFQSGISNFLSLCCLVVPVYFFFIYFSSVFLIYFFPIFFHSTWFSLLSTISAIFQDHWSFFICF